MKYKEKLHATNVQRAVVTALAVFFIVVSLFQAGGVEASMKAPPPEKVKVIIIGDRVVDIAYNLGVLPEAMSVRGCMWPMAKKLKVTSQMLGCPRCIVVKKETVPTACRKFGVKRLIIEKSDPYCIYKPKVKPENVVPLMSDTDVTIEYVDFSKGLEEAVRQTAEMLDRTDKAAAVIERYRKQLASAQSKLPKEKTGKRVIIFNGIYQATTGKSMLRVEAPGGYADRFLLSKLGCINAGDAFKPDDGKPTKGHYMVPKKKGILSLKPLIAADPDAIVMTGDTFAVQKAMADYRAAHPEMAKVKAIRNLAVYALPRYVDSSVLEYPVFLKKWAAALAP